MEKKINPAVRFGSAAVAAGLALGLSAAGAPLALAHDAVIGGSPADNETVQDFPDTLTLDFSGSVQEGFNTVTLSHSEKEEVIFSGEPVVEGTKVSLTLPEDLEAEPGSYRIGYQIVSSDGHPNKGITNFTFEPAVGAESADSTEAVEGAAAGSTGSAAEGTQEAGKDANKNANATESTEETADEGFDMSWLWALAILLMIGGVVAAAFARINKIRETQSDNRPDSATTPKK